MLDHTTFYVKDLNKSVAFYDAALAPIGYSHGPDFVHEGTRIVGYTNAEGKADHWIVEAAEPSTRLHIAFKAPSREAVQGFYDGALAHGGTDNGAPGLRKEYGEDYYAAFARDPDGNNIEVVTHAA